MSATRWDELRRAAADFHARHPEVWELFVRFAFEKIRDGHAHYSADAVMHRVRWETPFGDDREQHGFKINDHLVAFYARRFMRIYEGQVPVRFFRFRRQTSQGR